MSKSNMQQLADLGQSVWLDYIDRPLLETGKLQKLIEQGLRGMTSNPSIFNNAIGNSNDYDEKIVQLKNAGRSTFEIYDELTIKDIQDAADAFKGVFDATKGLDGYVSLEINPQLANQFEEQAREGRRLWKKVNRANVMIKVPSTANGLKVVEELIADGINVNVTLIFSLEQYVNTAKAYMAGLKRLSENGGDLSKVRSVASFFVSRIDTAIDKMIDEELELLQEAQTKAHLLLLKGKAAVANCREAYKNFQKISQSDDFKQLQQKGAHQQRLLWASTSTKNPEYNAVKYVAELISSPTVNTIPEKTLMTFMQEQKVAEAFNVSNMENGDVLEALKSFGIHIDEVCAVLLTDGVKAFDDSFVELFASIEKKAAKLVAK